MNTGLEGQNTLSYEYSRVGSARDAKARTQAGFALMGGGSDLDEAFRWMCSRAAGGDFLVLRAAGTGAYNSYIAGLEDGGRCKLNSVATLVIPSQKAAAQSFVANTIANAEAIFIAGGDQANYVRFWAGTPVQVEINSATQRGVPIGGTSAGLAVMGEWAYSAEGDKPDGPNLDSKTALADPNGPRVTLVHGFLDIPWLRDVITDSHFSTRDRMGRVLAFLAHINDQDQATRQPARQPTLQATHSGAAVRGIGIEQGVALLLDSREDGRVIGNGAAYFIHQNKMAHVTESGKGSTGRSYEVEKVSAGHAFDLTSWSGDGVGYRLTVDGGQVHSAAQGGHIY